jgi:hypothetical protein
MSRHAAAPVAAAPVAAAPVAAALLLVTALGVGGCAGPAAPASAPPLTWEQIDPDPNGHGGPSSFASWSGGTVGVGGNRAWRTTDGRSWTSIPLPGAEANDHAGGIVATQDRLVAVGSVASVPAIWTSSDGETWERLEDVAAPAGFQGSIEHVAAGPAGIVAVGTAWGPAQHPVAWWSADGRDWVGATTAIDGTGPRGLIATPDGFVLAAADNARPGQMTGAAFWRSSDGREWTRAADDPSFANAEPRSLAMRDGTIVAVGFRFSGPDLSAAAWTSPDGDTWTAAPAAPALAWWPFPGPTPVHDQDAIQGSVMSGVFETETGFIAVGTHHGYDPTQPQPGDFYALAIRSGIWQSPDGLAWELVPNDLLVRHATGDEASYVSSAILGVEEINGTLVIVGRTLDLGVLLWVGSTAPE